MRLEGKLCRAGKLGSETFGAVLALHIEFKAVRGADRGVRKVDGDLGNRVFAVVVIVLKLMKVFGGGDHVVASRVARREHVSRLALQGALDQWLGCFVVLVGERDAVYSSWIRVWIDQHLAIAGHKTSPLEIWWNSLGSGEHVAIKGLILLCLSSNELIEGSHGLLDDLNDVSLESSKVVLDRDGVIAVVVLLHDLLVQSVVDTTMDDIWIIAGLDLATCTAECSRMLTEKLDVLLRLISCLVDLLGRLSGPGLKLLRLVLDFLVQSFEDWKYGALEVLLRLGMGV